VWYQQQTLLVDHFCNFSGQKSLMHMLPSLQVSAIWILVTMYQIMPVKTQYYNSHKSEGQHVEVSGNNYLKKARFVWFIMGAKPLKNLV
jgi:hypothetical protein